MFQIDFADRMWPLFPFVINSHISLDPRQWSAGMYMGLIALLLLIRLLAPWRNSPFAHFTEEVCLILPAGLFYFFARGQGHAATSEAFDNSHRIVSLEERLGLFIEPRLQDSILHHRLLVDFFNWIYVWGHWPVILPWIVWMWFRHHDDYAIYRNSILLSGAIGMMIFATFPVAPPRLIPDLGMVDIVTLNSHAYRVLQPSALTNLYAAMPSLHFGWDLLVGIAIARHATNRYGRALGVLLPVAMFSAILLTANHFILDGIAGATLALISLAIAIHLTPRWSPWLTRPAHRREGSFWRNASLSSDDEPNR